MDKKVIIFLLIIIASMIAMMAYLWMSLPSIVYVRSDYLLEKYEGMTDARADYKSKADVWQGNVDTLKSTLEFTIQEYELQRDKMPKTKREEKEKFIRAKQKDLMTYSNAIEQKAREEDQKLTTEVINNINNFLKEYGKKKGYDVMLGANGSGSIIYGNETMDITEEVLEELNKWYNEGT